MKLTPKIALCSAFFAGDNLTEFALNFPYPVEFVATCDRDSSEFEEKIARKCAEKGVDCLRKVNVNSPEFIAELRRRKIDFVFLCWWPAIIKQEAISAANIGWVNLHPSFLPYGRGKHGYYWSIVEGFPFGVTLHFVDEGIDTGDILFQREIPVEITDTGESLYAKSFEESLALWKESYPKFLAMEFEAKKQDESLATFRWAKEIEQDSEIYWDKSYLAGDLLNRMRGRTFLRGESGFFRKDGKKYFVKIIIEPAQE